VKNLKTPIKISKLKGKEDGRLHPPWGGKNQSIILFKLLILFLALSGILNILDPIIEMVRSGLKPPPLMVIYEILFGEF
jgi:hypothetical protein